MAIDLGYGMYYFPAETDPEKIQKASERFGQWKEKFDQVVSSNDLYGWDSPECEKARQDLEDWKAERMRVDGC